MNLCRLVLSRAGALVMRNNTGAYYDKTGRLVQYGEVGSADIICCYRGKFLAVECKVKKRKAKDHQLLWGDAVRRAGGTYAVVRSVEDLMRVIGTAGETDVG